MKNKFKNKFKNKLTLFFVASMLFFASFLLAACVNTQNDLSVFNNSLYTHLVVKNHNQTVESFVLNYNQTVWENPVDKDLFETNVKDFFNTYSQSYNNHLKQNFSSMPSSFNFTEVVFENDNIILKVLFPDKTIWGKVTQKQGVAVPEETEKNLFTITRADRLEKVGSVIKVEDEQVYFGDYFFNKLHEFLQNQADNVLQSSQIKNAFVYATDKKRQHSNAQNIAYLQGRYFHQWNLTQSPVEIKFFSTFARVEVWYGLAIVLAFGTALLVYVVSLFAKNNKQKKKVKTKKLATKAPGKAIAKVEAKTGKENKNKESKDKDS